MQYTDLPKLKIDQSFKLLVYQTKFMIIESHAQESGHAIHHVEPSLASFKSGLQVIELKGFLYVTKIDGMFKWDGLTSEVQIETSNALFVSLAGHTKQISAPHEFGAVHATRLRPDWVSWISRWKSGDTHCGRGLRVKG
jgi:hypothetical protein